MMVCHTTVNRSMTGSVLIEIHCSFVPRLTWIATFDKFSSNIAEKRGRHVHSLTSKDGANVCIGKKYFFLCTRECYVKEPSLFFSRSGDASRDRQGRWSAPGLHRASGWNSASGACHPDQVPRRLASHSPAHRQNLDAVVLRLPTRGKTGTTRDQFLRRPVGEPQPVQSAVARDSNSHPREASSVSRRAHAIGDRDVGLRDGFALRATPADPDAASQRHLPASRFPSAARDGCVLENHHGRHASTHRHQSRRPAATVSH